MDTVAITGRITAARTILRTTVHFMARITDTRRMADTATRIRRMGMLILPTATPPMAESAYEPEGSASAFGNACNLAIARVRQAHGKQADSKKERLGHIRYPPFEFC